MASVEIIGPTEILSVPASGDAVLSAAAYLVDKKRALTVLRVDPCMYMFV